MQICACMHLLLSIKRLFDHIFSHPGHGTARSKGIAKQQGSIQGRGRAGVDACLSSPGRVSDASESFSTDSEGDSVEG